MKLHTAKSRMRGVALSFGEPDIEFEGVIMTRVIRRKRIVVERLPQAKKNGRDVKVMRRIKTQQISRKPNKTKAKCMSVVR